MYDNILFPTDGSEGAAVALDHVRELAAKFGATVHVLTVVDERTVGLGGLGGGREKGSPGLGGKQKKSDSPGLGSSRRYSKEIREAMTERGESIVSAAADELADVSTQTVVRGGNPHRVIVDYAADNEIDLVVMGTQGRTGVSRHLLGSVAEKVVRTSPVPVVTVRNDD